MNCKEYENLITEYLENTAPHALRIQMESHLSECEKCHKLAEQEMSVMEQLNEISIEPCPDEIIDNIMELISVPSMSVKECIRSWFMSWRSTRYGVASLAGSLAIALFVLLISIPGNQVPKTEDIEYSPEEIRQATVEAKLALAYFAVYSRKTETALKKINILDPVIKPIKEDFKKALGKIPYI